MQAERCAGETEVTIRVKGVGHAFPTGDPFRRVVVEVWDEKRHSQFELAHKSRPLGERFTWSEDTRIQPCAVDVCEERLTFTQPATHWRLRFLYANPHDEPKLAIADREVVMSEGIVSVCAGDERVQLRNDH